MTLHPINHWQVPPETARVARASFPKGNVYMKMYDELGTIYTDSDFQQLFPARCGQSAISPAKLALIAVMQFAEGLSDSQAADAVRSRIDWKYLLGLDLTVESNQIYQVSLIGPVAVDTSWQAKSETGFDVSTFVIDWDNQVAQCPQGHLSRGWRNAASSSGNPLVEVVFDRKTCGACPVRNNCTSSAMAPRKLKLKPRAEYEALVARRREQLSDQFKLCYASRAGIEGTISQGVRRFD